MACLAQLDGRRSRHFTSAVLHRRRHHPRILGVARFRNCSVQLYCQSFTMTDVAQALADLHLTSSTINDCFWTSPQGSRLRHPHSTPPAVRHVSLFPELHRASARQLETARHPEAHQAASWSAIVGDIFQAVVENLPAHTAQHAMLVCRQWHDSVTNGLVCLRPRALRLDCISSRSVLHMHPQAQADPP